MGISTHCIFSCYSPDKVLLQKIELDESADGFIYHLLDDGGATFDPGQLGEFDPIEQTHLKLYFDAHSMSAFEELASPRPNLHLAADIRPTWEKLEASLIVRHQQQSHAYQETGESTMTADSFRRLTDTYEANLACIRRINGLLEVAEKGNYWVEITAVDC